MSFITGKGTSMPSERTRVYLDDLDDRFENRDKFYKELNKQINREKQMKWKYGLIRKKYDDEVYYEVGEIYGQEPDACYAENINLHAETTKDIISMLETILTDLKTNLIIVNEISINTKE